MSFMKHALLIAAATAVCSGSNRTALAKKLTLQQGVDKVVRGYWFKKGEVVNIGRHGFELRPFKVQRVANGIKASGYFRHKVKGKDDRIYFEIEAINGRPPQGRITKIEYRGLFGSRVVKNVASIVWGAKGKINLVFAQNVQKLLVGIWEPAAGTIVGHLAKRTAERYGVK